MFVWQAAKSEAIAPLENLTWSPIVIDNNTTKVDLTLSMTEEKTAQGDRLSGKFEYRCDLFKAGTIEAMADAFATLLAAVSQNPEQPLSALKWVSERQRQQIQQWNETTRDYPAEQTLHQLFEQQAVRSPQAPALITATQALSYQQVNNRTNQLAQQLQRLGVCPEMRVGICLDRSADLIVAILATLKAGGAYVPLDPAYPHSRLAYIVEDAQISVLLTQSAYQALMPSVPHRILLDSQTSFSQVASQTSICSDQSEIESSVTDGADRPPTESAQSHNLAYIIYTSGSTGQPKGVAIEHRSPVALVQWAREAFSPEQLSGVLAATSVCFDLSIFEIFVPLSVGGSVILAEDVLQLPTLPASCQVTLINTVPTAIAELLRINGIPQSVTTINLAGEPIPATLVKQLYALASVQKVFNLYGPSEDTTYSTYSLLSPDDAIVPIGRPIANTQIYLLDANQNLVPIGMPGELYLGGSGLARGYWNQAQMTSERFISSPYAEDPSYLYKTGDLARYRPAGQLEFLGRIDQQVKVRGFRIELGEIESALLAHAQVAQAAAMLWHDPQNNRRLVAYAVLTNCAEDIVFNQALSPLSETFELLQRHLKTILPSYMLPALLVPLEALPLLPNGKINRKALFEFTPTLSAPTLKEAIDETTLALSPSEQILVAVWQALLSQPVGIHDNFFELGGDSILAIQASAQAQQSGLYFSARDLFQHSTISQLAAVATQQSPATGQQSPIVGAVPLTPTQHWFFEQNLTAPHHWNQAVLLTVKQALQPDILAQALRGLMRHHDALRAVFQPPVADAAASYDSADSLWTQFYREPSDVVPLKVIKRTVEDVAQLNAIITAEAKAAQTSFNLEQGPLLQIVYYDLQTPTGNERRLLIVCHHLLIDGVSWRILLNDLQHLYQQLSQQPQVEQTQQEQPLSYTVAQLPPKTMSCQQWINYLTTADFVSELPYWESIVAAELPPLPQDFSLDSTNNNVMATAETHSVALSTQQTHRLLKELPKGYSVRVDDILLAALLLALQPWAGNSLRISLEGHGRLEEHNLSRTVGWLTAIYPVLLSIPPDADLAADFSETIKSVKETLRGVPSQGVGYGALRYLQGRSLLAETPIRFNYLGQSDQLFSADGWLQVATEATGAARSPQDKRDVLLEINAIVVGGQLKLHWTYSRQLHAQATISRWASAYLSQLEALIDHCLSIETDLGYSPSDFPQMGLSQGELDDLLANLGGETR
jgi:amino acid adenylation domain-containing protein/non-ribosomal peptide synthase protein (TIGR01720 family)